MEPPRLLATALLLHVAAVRGWFLARQSGSLPGRRAGLARGTTPFSWMRAAKYVSGVYPVAEDGLETNAKADPRQATSSNIEYQSQNVTPHVDHFNIKRGNLSIRLEVDKLNGTVSASCLNCDGHEVSPEAKNELNEFSKSNHLRLLVPETHHYGILGQLASWVSKIPKGVVLSVVTVRMYSQIECLHHYDLAEAVWSRPDGRRANKTVLVGNSVVRKYECQGKCGSDCSNPYGAYTRNCLNHDSCSLDAHSVNGYFDSACGDEWRNAMGDYMMGFAVCGDGTAAM